ncbi:phosphoenolpyruvate-protein phosphotransferase [Clostridia bacterium]|nr:phosphoenolpyruvate-protein phosphotransferase [Clostridia bacterium]
MLIIKGTRVFQGVAEGPLYFLKTGREDIRRERTDDVEGEIFRFETACLKASAQLDILFEKALNEVGEKDAEIFKTHQMMLSDLDFHEAAADNIRVSKCNAEYAVEETAKQFAAIFSAMEDSYMSERATDVFSVAEYILRVLSPNHTNSHGKLQTPSIIAAREISPADAVQLEKSMLLGFATAEGSLVSHTSILARSMGLPAVIGLGAVLDPGLEGKHAILDGFTGTLYIEPDAETAESMRQIKGDYLKRLESLNELRGRPNTTLDGTEIDVFANVNSLSGLDDALENDAGGIGLFRSEFIYMEKDTYPTEEEQFDIYRQAAQRMGGKKVIIRTLDIGADKQSSYFELPEEENPAMGLRAIRICLTRPEIFKTQLRALYRASAFGKIAIMFPMIISVHEVMKILIIANEVKAELRRDNIEFDEDIELGIMIETPAAVMISDALAETVDFFSIGTNDLTQYTLAIDRQNPALECFYDAHHPALLKMIQMTVVAAHRAGKWCGICGELGADLELTETFLRMGVDEISVPASMVLPLRERITSLDLSVD